MCVCVRERLGTHHKPETILQVDLSDAPVTLEELFHVPLPGMRAQAADKHTTSAHGEKDLSVWERKSCTSLLTLRSLTLSIHL